MKNPKLTTANGIPESLSNLYCGSKCSAAAIQDAVEDSSTGSELAANLNRLNLFEKFSVDRETPVYARLTATDCWGNKMYFRAEK